MGVVIRQKLVELDNHIKELNRLRCVGITQGSNFSAIVKEAEEITKLASFLDSYKDLDKDREREVKETIMIYFNREHTYDSTLLKCIGYCFGECD